MIVYVLPLLGRPCHQQHVIEAHEYYNLGRNDRANQWISIFLRRNSCPV